MDLEPEHNEAIAMCVRAWHDLATCRPIGMAVGPIPWTAIVAWVGHAELDREAATLVIHVVQHLEQARAEKEAVDRARKTALGE